MIIISIIKIIKTGLSIFLEIKRIKIKFSFLSEYFKTRVLDNFIAIISIQFRGKNKKQRKTRGEFVLKMISRSLSQQSFRVKTFAK